jgi:hypothetical protein
MRICQIWFFCWRRVLGLEFPRPGKSLKIKEVVTAEKAPWVRFLPLMNEF